MSERQPNFLQSEEEPKSDQESEQAVEMPDDLADPEGESGVWETITGKVEIEGKMVDVSYREKVTELSKHRQEETGISRVRRRELLPPLPEGLFLTPQDRRSLSMERGEWYVEFEKREAAEGKEYFPAYSGDVKFDELYRFITDGMYPNSDNYVHIVHYIHARYKSDRSEMINEEIAEFIRRGLYFQEIEKRMGMSFDLYPIHMYNHEYANPVFVFSGEENSPLFEKTNLKETIEYQKKKGLYKKHEINLGISDCIDPLRFCHAECALVPTKRGLNVLFFETDDKSKQ